MQSRLSRARSKTKSRLLSFLLPTVLGLVGGAGAQELKLIHADSPFGFITYQTMGGGPLGGKGDYRHYARDMRDLGVHWVRATGRRTAFMWGRIQRGPEADYDWTMVDRAIRNLQREKIMILAQLLTVVNWAKDGVRQALPGNARGRRRGRSWGDVEARYHAQYAQYISAVVERYDGDGIDDMPGLRYPIKYWMLENEPEVQNVFWADTAENLGRLCALTYKAMLEADPQASLVIPGPGPGGVMEYLKLGESVPELFAPKASRWAMRVGPRKQDGFFVRLMRQLKADMGELSPENLIFDFHLYGDWFDYLGYKHFVAVIQKRLKELGYGERRIWVTEAGTYSGRNAGHVRRADPLAAQKATLPSQSEREQARSLVQRFVYGAALGIGKQFWFTVKGGANEEGSYFNLTGLIRLDDRKKLGYHALSMLVRKSRDVLWAEVTQVDSATPGAFVFRLPRRTGTPLYVAWLDPRDAREMPLEIDQPLEVEISRLTGTSLEVISAITNPGFVSAMVPISGGKARVLVGRDPVYLESRTAGDRQRSKAEEKNGRESPFAFNDLGLPSRVARKLGDESKEAWVRVVQSQKVLRFRELGIQWARVHCDTYGTFGWSGVDADHDGKGLDFSRQDALVRLAQRNGIHLLPVLSPTPTEEEWLSASTYVPEDTEAYSAYVRQLVERYDGDGKDDMEGLLYPIRYWQLENEPDLHNRTRTRMGSPDFCSPGQYAAVLKLTSQALKQADKAASLLLNVVGFGQNPGDSSVKYLEELNELGARDHYDLLSYHVYPDVFDTSLLRKMHAEFRRLAGAGKPIWITESGIASRPKKRRLENASERSQAAWVIQHHVFHIANGVKRVAWSSFTDMERQVPETRPAKDAGLLTFSPTRPKLSYYTYKKMVEVLDGSDWEKTEVLHQGNGIYIYKFVKAGKPIWVAWNDNKQEKIIKMPLDEEVRDVVMIRAVPNLESGDELGDYNDAFNSVSTDSQVIVMDGKPRQLVFDLGSSPVFLIGD